MRQGHEMGSATMIVLLIQLDRLTVNPSFKSSAPSSFGLVRLGLLGLLGPR